MVIHASKKPVEEQLIRQISLTLDIPSSLLNPYTDFTDDLMLDAFEINLLIIDLEKYFDVYFSSEVVASIDNVRDLTRAIEKYAA